MGTSVAQLKYGTYVFSPVPQVGVRSNYNRLGESGMGPANRERVVSIRGRVYGNNLNEVQTAMAQLEAIFAKGNQTLYWYDGVTVRINQTAQPISLDWDEEWGEYDLGYKASFKYIPLGETHNDLYSASYGGYTFHPIPVLSREFTVQRESPESDRDSTKVQLALTGFIDKGSLSANLTEFNSLKTALQTDGQTLTFGDFTQSVKVSRLSHSSDVLDRHIGYVITFEYDEDVGADSVLKMSSTRSIQSSQTVAKAAVPFRNGTYIQKTGGNGQVISANGYILARSMAEAKAAAAIEIAAQFPAALNSVEETRNIREKASEKRVEWDVTVYYPTPILTGGVYGNLVI